MTRFDALKEAFPDLIPIHEYRANISIYELAVHYGYTQVLTKGQSQPIFQHPAHQDRIIIRNPAHPAEQFYQGDAHFLDSGTLIDFVRNRLSTVFSVFNQSGQHEFLNIIQVLTDYLKIHPDLLTRNRSALVIGSGAQSSFNREIYDIRPLLNDNFLLKTGIASSIIQGSEFHGKVFSQITYLNPETGHSERFSTVKINADRQYLKVSNLVFPLSNGNSEDVTGYEVGNDQFPQYLPGSDQLSSVFISNLPPASLRFVVLESVLDAMAHRQLRSIRDDESFNSVYFSTGGQLTPEQISTISRTVGALNKLPDWKIVLSFDTTIKGHRYDLQFVQQLVAPHFPLSLTVAMANRIGYILPTGDLHLIIREALLKRVEFFNGNVRGQIPYSEADDLSKKELNLQLIGISQIGQQTVLYIPETVAALFAISSALLELTGLEKRISFDKSLSKNFRKDLERHLEVGKRFAYAILDEAGNELYNSNSAVTIQRTLIHLQNQATIEELTVTFRIVFRQSNGWFKEQARCEVRDGVIYRATERPEFKKKILEEKKDRSTQASEKRPPHHPGGK